jgi:hypothetical protein
VAAPISANTPKATPGSQVTIYGCSTSVS